MNDAISNSDAAPQASPDRGPTVVVVNAGSRAGAEAPADLVAALAQAGVKVDALRATADPSVIAAAVREAVAAGASRVLVGGGDGTISLVAGILAGGQTALGVLPLGTGNDFARNLHIPRELERSAAVIAHGRVRAVPVGVVNGRTFLNALSFGISSAVTQRLTPGLKRRAGPLAYPIAAVAEAIAPEPFRLAMRAGDERWSGDALQVVVGNGRYHAGGTVVAPDARIGDAELDVYVVAAPAGVHDEGAVARASNAWTLLRVGMMLRRGRHLEHPLVHHVRCVEAEFDCTPPQEVNADGEIVGQTPIRCGVRPAALRVIVP